ncbi:MAG: hypothetical protein KC912_20890 [Proteobacteria bacterium]|nr:hypothetical protein [Pseudomonadota bacterium]
MRALVLLPFLLTACAGSGECGEQVRVGVDASPFVPYCSGDAMIITEGSTGYGMALAFEIEGIDGTTGAQAVLRATFTGDSSQDVIGGVILNDRGEGLWATNTFFPLREQTEAEVAALDGRDVQFSAVFTDGEATMVETVLQLVADAP